MTLINNREHNASIYTFSFIVSLLIHITFIYLFIFSVGQTKFHNQQVVYTISIETGLKLGGIEQISANKKKSKIAPPKKQASAPLKKNKSVTKNNISKDNLKKTTIVREQDKVKKTAKLQKKIPVTTKNKNIKTNIKKKSVIKKKVIKKKPAPIDLDKELSKAVQRYTGESSDAGGSGFGAANIGSGKGMGGGVVRPREFFIYKENLERYIKEGWHWHNREAKLKAAVCFNILKDGSLVNIKLCQSSGNYDYDQSVVRAVIRANPAPPPPSKVYNFFKFVKMTFIPME